MISNGQFEEFFAEIAERSGIGELSRKYHFAPQLNGMMIELRDKVIGFLNSTR